MVNRKAVRATDRTLTAIRKADELGRNLVPGKKGRKNLPQVIEGGEDPPPIRIIWDSENSYFNAICDFYFNVVDVSIYTNKHKFHETAHFKFNISASDLVRFFYEPNILATTYTGKAKQPPLKWYSNGGNISGYDAFTQNAEITEDVLSTGGMMIGYVTLYDTGGHKWHTVEENINYDGPIDNLPGSKAGYPIVEIDPQNANRPWLQYTTQTTTLTAIFPYLGSGGTSLVIPVSTTNAVVYLSYDYGDNPYTEGYLSLTPAGDINPVFAYISTDLSGNLLELKRINPPLQIMGITATGINPSSMTFKNGVLIDYS